MTIRGSTAVYGVLGKPVRHSRSPAVHNEWFARFGLDAVYVAFESDEAAAIDGAFVLGVAGLNVTTPLKAHALALAQSAEPAAVQTGAANVLVRRATGWHALNTDVEGLCQSIERENVAIAGRRAVVIGAGGAARAAVVGLAARGARSVEVLARRPDAAAAVAAIVGGQSGPIDSRGLAGRDLVVVATSGRAEAVGALDPSALGPGAVWVDLNYWDPDPPGFGAARAAGCRVVDGSGMLLGQAALSFEAWTGIQISSLIFGDSPSAGRTG